MTKHFKTLYALLPLVALCPSCSKNVNVKEILPYIFETQLYTELDHKYADEYYAKEYDNWGGGGCSAISYEISGRRLVGRNMDLNISNKPAYIVRADTGKYKTIGLAYSFRDVSKDYDIVKKNGITEDFHKILPFICDDVLNDKGLHVELNMRHAEYWPDGRDMFACEHTNPGADRRVHMFELPRLIAENCETIDETIAYLNTLDIYSKNHYWNYCFLVSDPNTSALVEFCKDSMYVLYEDQISSYNQFLKDVAKIDFEFNAISQTNFYMNYAAFVMEDIKTGIGRLETMNNGIKSVTNSQELFDLMDKIAYSNVYLPYYQCKNEHFDPRSEQIGEFEGASYEVVMNPDFEPYLAEALNAYNEPIRKMTRQQKQDANKYWESSFTEVVNCTKKHIIIRFFEDENKVFKIDFEKTQIIQRSNIEF